MKNRLVGGYDLILLVNHPEAGKGSPSGRERLQGRRLQMESLFLKAGLLK